MCGCGVEFTPYTYYNYFQQHKAISIMYAASQAGTLKQMKHDLGVKTSGQIHVGFVS